MSVEVIEIPAGEKYKNLDSCLAVWKALSDKGADRKSLLINLGGGVVCDLGGFVAATYKRGIAFINIPTTLLSMVDASAGGKTGIDLDGLKNQVGVIEDAVQVLIWPEFLDTLSEREVYSGFAEMLKHGLIQDRNYWSALRNLDSPRHFREHIHHSVAIKASVVCQDPKEHGLRKILNFGHTLGHAVETHFLESPALPTLLHGEAIAVGMIMEAYLSVELAGMPEDRLQEITNTLLKYFKKVDIPESDWKEIKELLAYDKKNSHGTVLFVLLEDIGKPQIDRQVPGEMIKNAFAYYRDL